MYQTNNKNYSKKNRNDLAVWRKMRYLTFMAAIGGFLFGYDTGVVSGAMLPMKRALGLTQEQQEVVVSCTVFAAFVSSLCVGAPLNDKLGRRKSILGSSLVFGIGSLVLMFSNGYWALVVGRIILGLGIGVASLTTPVYIAEVALPEMRGRLVTVNTLMITFGQFFAGMVDGFFVYWMPETGWRYMLGLAALPSAIMFVGFLGLPESPRWLVSKGKYREALVVLEDLRASKEEAESELKEIILASSSGGATTNANAATNESSFPSRRRVPNRGGYRDDDDDDDGDGDGDDNGTDPERSSLASSYTGDDGDSSPFYGSDGSSSPNDSDKGQLQFSNNNNNNNECGFEQRTSGGGLGAWVTMLSDAPTRRALLLGCGLMAVQQFSGINTVMYYAASIYEMAGYDELTAVWLSGFTALAQVVGIATSIVLVDKVGRRTLVLYSLGFVAVSLVGLASSFYWARISSGDVATMMNNNNNDDDEGATLQKCAQQPAMVWDGFVAYCYDCAKIDGCGYCGQYNGEHGRSGLCLPGNDSEPTVTNNNNNNTPCDFWDYDTCRSGGSSPISNSNNNNPYGILSVLFMVLYLLAFGIGMGGMPWTINSEIYKLEFRSMAVSLSTATNWIGNLVVSATFLTLSSPGVLTAYGAFGLYGGVALLGWAWLVWALPETKGLSMEEIEDLFRRPWDDNNGRMLVETRDLDNNDDDDDTDDEETDNGSGADHHRSHATIRLSR